MDFADLAIIDLSKAHTHEGRAELAPQLRDALRTNGFVYAINHGYTQAQVCFQVLCLVGLLAHQRDQRDRVFDIADVPFAAVPPEEKKIYTENIEKVGYYAGYKARQYWARRFLPPLLLPPNTDLLVQKVDTENGVLDQIEHYGRAYNFPFHTDDYT